MDGDGRIAIVATFMQWSLVALGILLASVMGWAASSLHVLAGWVDGAPAAAKLEIMRGIITSIAAGLIVMGLGYHYEVPLVLTFIGAFFAGLSGEKYLKPLSERIDRLFTK